MAITEAFAGSKAFSTFTDWSLPHDAAYSSGTVKTDDGVYQICIDLSALAYSAPNADAFTLYVYEKARTGDTKRLCYGATFYGSVNPPIYVMPSLILLNGWDVRLECGNAIASRTITWSIRKVA